MRINIELNQLDGMTRCLTSIAEEGKETMCLRENFPSDKEYPPIAFSYALSYAAIQLNSYLINKYRDESNGKKSSE